MMKHVLILAFIALFSASVPVMAAECFADYKAKQDSPLRLHYGVIQLQGPCTRKAARAEASARLAQQGWTLLNILGVFGPEGLAQRKSNAGSFYLRF